MHDPLASVSTSTGWIAGQVRRASRNSLIWNGVVLFLMALLIWFSGNYYYNFFCGPFPFDDARLLQAAENPGSGGLLAYVELQPHPLQETGWKEISTTDGKPYSEVPYFMTPVGDKMMIVMAKDAADATLTSILGRLAAEKRHEVTWGEMLKEGV